MAPTKKRIKASEKRAAVLRLRTETVEQVARSMGVTTQSVRNWEVTYGGPAPAAPSPTEAIKVNVVTLPDAGAPPEVEKEGGGYDAARAAAGLGPPPEDAPPPPEPPKDDTPKIPPEKTLVFMSEMALGISVRFYAARCKVPLDDELKHLAKLTDGERADLETYAPYAAPFMSQMLLKYGVYIGAGIYGFIFWTMLTDRYAEIKARAPKKVEAEVKS